MLTVRTTIDKSKLHGIGLFADEFIPKGTVIWRFTPRFDLRLTPEEILSFPKLLQTFICKYAWCSTKSGFYCLSSDNGKYFNHSYRPNAMSEYRDEEEEVITVALTDINRGEEITDDYSSFENHNDNMNLLNRIATQLHLEDEIDPRFKN